MSKKRKRAVPDEEFVAGPFRFARFGKLIEMQSNWPEGAFEEFKRATRDGHDALVTRIDGLVETIARLVTSVDPLHLRLYARSCFEAALMGVETEVETDWGQLHAQRMLDYTQSVIASAPRRSGEFADITPEVWDELSERTEELFLAVTRDYLQSWMFKREHEEGMPATRGDPYVAMSTAHWMGVKNQRYQFHEPRYLLDVFLPHSDLLEDVYGVTGEELVAGMTAILESLTRGLSQALQEYHAIDLKWRDLTSSRDLSDDELRKEAARAAGGQSALDAVLARLHGPARFDVTALTELPDALLEDLAWAPGEERDFFAEGDYRGWPLRVWPISKRPFLRLGDRIYCFDLASLFDNVYRVIQRAVVRRNPKSQERWNQAQQRLSEGLAVQYFEQLLPGARCWQSVHYRDPGTAGGSGWCETDALIAYDRHLFVVECRAGAFTYTPPATDLLAQVESLRNLVVKPAEQGHRFVDYLQSARSVALHDQSRQAVGTIRAGDFDHIVVCGVTLDVFTELAAGTKQRVELGAGVDGKPIWSLSIDDLRVFSDVFSDSLQFLHFVQERYRALTDPGGLEFNDELDHVGLYFAHGNYVKALDIDGAATVNTLGYRADMDRFFTKKLTEADATFEQAKLSPPILAAMVSALSRSQRIGRFRAAERLLGFGADERAQLQEGIVRELEEQRHRRRRRAKAISTRGSDGLTIFCWGTPWAPRASDLAWEHTCAVAGVHDDRERLLLELTFDEHQQITDVDWRWVDAQAVPGPMRERLQREADALRSTRIAEARAEVGKIGRNDPCPCGSGRKWKKCCLQRQ